MENEIILHNSSFFTQRVFEARLWIEIYCINDETILYKRYISK